MKKRDVERTQLVQIQKDLSDAPAILVTMETDSTAQVSQCFIPFSRQGPYKVSHSPDQTIVEGSALVNIRQKALGHLMKFTQCRLKYT